MNVTFNITEGPEGQDPRRSTSSATRRSATASSRKQDEGEQGPRLVRRSSPAAAPTRKTSSTRTPSKVIEYYRDHGYIAAQVGQPELKILEDSKDGKTRWVELRVPVTEGERYTIGEFSFEGNKVVKAEALRPLFKFEQGEYLQREEDQEGLRKGARGLRRRRLLRVHGLSRSAAARRAPAPTATAPTARRRLRPRPPRPPRKSRPIVDVTMRVTEGKQYFVNRITFTGNTTTRDNVIRREMRLRRRRRVQHRGAEVQRQAPQSARLLQAARRRRHRRREDAGRRQQGRRHAEARRAEPQPADVRRRRVAVRRLLRPAVVPDLELPRPRRNVHASPRSRAAAPRTTSSRSPSRSCSTGRSPAASTSTTARSATSGSSRRSRPAATSSTGSRLADFSRMFVNYSYERSRSRT